MLRPKKNIHFHKSRVRGSVRRGGGQSLLKMAFQAIPKSLRGKGFNLFIGNQIAFNTI